MATTRREFLRTGALGALGVGLMGPLDASLAAPRLRPRLTAIDSDRVVVAVNLFGGNDGLNTVVPLAQYERYRELRLMIGLAREQLVALPGHQQEFGLNPGMQALAALFRRGKVALINGVGSPPDAQGLFDHEASQQNLQTGDTYGSAPPAAPTGWLGRFLDGVEPGGLPAGIDFSNAPLLLTGADSQPLSLSTLSGFGVYPSADSEARYAAYRRLQERRIASPVQERNRQLRLQVQALSGTLQEISHGYQEAPGVVYPYSELATALRDCAALIAAARGVRCLAVGFGGFDTHAGQNVGPPTAAPLHQSLWTTVSEAVAAFYADLEGHGLGDRVATLVFSEFGRRAGENNDVGTDHGLGALALVIGGAVKGGVYGDYPDLRDEYLVLEGNLDVRIDFRSVYATILAQQLGADPERILGGSFPNWDFFEKGVMMIQRLATLSVACWLLVESAAPLAAPAGQEPVGAGQSVVCTGDCDGDGTVGVDELTRGIAMVLGKIVCTDSQCAAAFCNASCGVGPACQPPRIECLLRAVRDALDGCPTGPCAVDAECDDGNRCSSDQCTASGCVRSCLCL